MTKLIVDGIEVDVPPHFTLLQAAEAAGAEIPRFCFHERLSVAGNCRMCLVELKGAPKPVASCAWAVRDCRPGPNGEPPVINTRTAPVKKAREGVLEFLLINHPLDCPICDQGGECDLQDQTMAYGVDTSRYHENKRAVEDKYIGPLVKTHMTRCIHCTRCVRFTQEVAGVGDLGAIGRGEDMEITTYLEAAMASEMQGNVVDLCPVGALISKPYLNRARPWELSKTESVDVMDAVGSAIRVDARGREVMRVLPRVNEAINEEWISDKTRHVADGLRTQRLDRAYVRDNGKLRPASWPEAFATIAGRLKSARTIGALAGDLAGIEEMFALKHLMVRLGSTNLDMQGRGGLDPRHGRASYLFNSTIEGIERAGSLTIVGSNPRKEAAVLNARIRKRWLQGNFQIGVIGEKVDLTYDYTYLGAGVSSLEALLSQSAAEVERPMLLVGAGAFDSADGAALLSLAAKAALHLGAVSEGWNGFNVLHTAASRVGALDLGFVPGAGGLDAAAMVRGGSVDVLFNLGADEVTVEPGAFMVYIGTHGDRGAHRADVILPCAAYTEMSATFVNTEGRVQMTNRATFPPGDAKEGWSIIRALSDVVGQRLPFDSLGQLRGALYAEHPHMAALDTVTEAEASAVRTLADLGGTARSLPFVSPIADFYLTNPIARASGVMAECSALASGRLAMAAE
jgi:NADH-quinone oxidoreductase subunit G